MLALSGAAKNPKKDRTHKPKKPNVLSIVHTSQLLGLSTLFLVFTIDQIIRISAGIRFLCIRLASGFLYEFVTMGKLNVDGSSVSTSRFFFGSWLSNNVFDFWISGKPMVQNMPKSSKKP